MTMNEVSVAGGRFSVRVWSEGQGRPVVYLHGYDGQLGDTPFLQRLAKTRQVFAPEHPGYGTSTGIDQIDGILDMTLYLRELLGALGLEKADVIGHSLGGMFAAELAAICPHSVDRLVLVSPFGLWLEEQEIPDIFVMSPNALQRNAWHAPEAPAAQAMLSRLANSEGGGAAIITRAMNLSAAGKFLWPIPDRGLAKRLRLITAPTQVIVGESDKLIGRPYGEAFASQIPNAKLSVIGEAGHFPMVESEDAFFAVLDGFLG